MYHLFIRFFSEETYAAQWKVLIARPLRKVRSSSGKGFVHVVELWKVEDEKEVNLAELLVSRGFAQSSDENSQ